MQGLFETLYADYKVQIYFFVKKYLSSNEDVEDVVQEIFVHLWKHKDTLADSVSKEAIIFKTAKQEIATFYRKHKLVFQSIEEFQIESESLSLISTGYTGEFELLRDKVKQELQNVPVRSREFFLDHKVSGKSYATIAKENGLSKSAVEKHVIKVLKHLQSTVTYNIEEVPFSLGLLFAISLV